MHDSERALYLENPKRPYSWTGELDSCDGSTSPGETQNGSLKMSRDGNATPVEVKDLYIKPDKRGYNSFRESSSRQKTNSPKRHFNLPHSSSQLLAEKLPVYRSENDDSSSKAKLPIPATTVAKEPKNEETKVKKKVEKKRSKFANLRRKTPPTMTSNVSDFEYFSLSQPPPGLEKPVQIFPPSAKPALRVVQKENLRAAKPEGEKCRDCMTRIPYATLIATILCCAGVGIFCGTMYRGTTLTLLMFDEVFRIKITWVEPVQLTFIIIAAAMGGLGLMILFLGFLSTGSTRAKVYRTWRGRVGGRTSCAIFMGLTYFLSIVWLLIFVALIVITVFYTLAFFQCETIPENECIDYNQFKFLFPSSTTEEDRKVCQEEKLAFCTNCVYIATGMFGLATFSAFLIIMSLIHYLICLSSNYAHIKDQEKFIDLQEIQYLQESEMSTLPKDRF